MLNYQIFSANELPKLYLGPNVILLVKNNINQMDTNEYTLSVYYEDDKKNNCALLLPLTEEEKKEISWPSEVLDFVFIEIMQKSTSLKEKIIDSVKKAKELNPLILSEKSNANNINTGSENKTEPPEKPLSLITKPIETPLSSEKEGVIDLKMLEAQKNRLYNNFALTATGDELILRQGIPDNQSIPFCLYEEIENANSFGINSFGKNSESEKTDYVRQAGTFLHKVTKASNLTIFPNEKKIVDQLGSGFSLFKPEYAIFHYEMSFANLKNMTRQGKNNTLILTILDNDKEKINLKNVSFGTIDNNNNWKLIEKVNYTDNKFILESQSFYFGITRNNSELQKGFFQKTNKTTEKIGNESRTFINDCLKDSHFITVFDSYDVIYDKIKNNLTEFSIIAKCRMPSSSYNQNITDQKLTLGPCRKNITIEKLTIDYKMPNEKDSKQIILRITNDNINNVNISSNKNSISNNNSINGNNEISEISGSKNIYFKVELPLNFQGFLNFRNTTIFKESNQTDGLLNYELILRKKEYNKMEVCLDSKKIEPLICAYAKELFEIQTKSEKNFSTTDQLPMKIEPQNNQLVFYIELSKAHLEQNGRLKKEYEVESVTGCYNLSNESKQINLSKKDIYPNTDIIYVETFSKN